MDFDKYVNSLNELDNQENKTELESFYTLHSAVLQFFKAIEKTVQDLMTRSSISPIVIKQLENSMPTLTKLKREITMFDVNTLHTSYKSKANQTIDYIKNDMTISEVNDMAQEFSDLSKESKEKFFEEEKNIAEQKAKEKRKEQGQKKEEEIKKYSEIKSALLKIKNWSQSYGGCVSFILGIDENCWIQVMWYYSENTLQIYALVDMGHTEREKFKQLGFTENGEWEGQMGYDKFYTNPNIDQVIQDMKAIFETIHNVSILSCEITQMAEL